MVLSPPHDILVRRIHSFCHSEPEVVLGVSYSLERVFQERRAKDLQFARQHVKNPNTHRGFVSQSKAVDNSNLTQLSPVRKQTEKKFVCGKLMLKVGLSSIFKIIY